MYLANEVNEAIAELKAKNEKLDEKLREAISTLIKVSAQAEGLRIALRDTRRALCLLRMHCAELSNCVSMGHANEVKRWQKVENYFRAKAEQYKETKR